jgi:hypothetical protein
MAIYSGASAKQWLEGIGGRKWREKKAGIPFAMCQRKTDGKWGFVVCFSLTHGKENVGNFPPRGKL